MVLNSKLFISTWQMLLNNNDELLTRKPKEQYLSVCGTGEYTHWGLV